MTPATPPDPDRLLTVAEAAAMLGVPEPLVRRWIVSGLKHIESRRRSHPKAPRGILIRRRWLDEYIEALGVRRRPAEATAPASPPARGKAKGPDGRIVLR